MTADELDCVPPGVDARRAKPSTRALIDFGKPVGLWGLAGVARKN